MTKMASEAVTRLHTRLENQRALIRTAEEEAEVLAGGMNGLCVELRKPLLIEKLFNCCEIWRRASTAVLELSGCRFWYDSTLKAVRTAENRPALYFMLGCPNFDTE